LNPKPERVAVDGEPRAYDPAIDDGP